MLLSTNNVRKKLNLSWEYGVFLSFEKRDGKFNFIERKTRFLLCAQYLQRRTKAFIFIKATVKA